MRSLKFPRMFGINQTEVWKSEDYSQQTVQNCKLLLQTERGTLLGDPFFGNMLKKYLFDQNNYLLKDIIIDTIYGQLVLFLPQLNINREDMDIFQDDTKGKLICKFSGTSQIDYTINTYSLELLSSSDI